MAHVVDHFLITRDSLWGRSGSCGEPVVSMGAFITEVAHLVSHFLIKRVSACFIEPKWLM